MVLLSGRMWCVSEQRLRKVVVLFSPCQPVWMGIVGAEQGRPEMSNYVEAPNFWKQGADQEQHRMEFRNRGRRVRPRGMQVMGAQLIKGIVALSGPWRLANDRREDGEGRLENPFSPSRQCEAQHHSTAPSSDTPPPPCHLTRAEGGGGGVTQTKADEIGLNRPQGGGMRNANAKMLDPSRHARIGTA